MGSEHDVLRSVLLKAATQGWNVLLEGPHGTGKTSLVVAVAKALDLRLKYYCTSTLDPFVDLVGLPVQGNDAQGQRPINYHRHEDKSNAELIFFDEINRAQPKVLNAVLEIIQFRRINGESLPHLKAVFAACNPSNSNYNVIDLDPALVDRFQIYMPFSPGPDRNWFNKTFGPRLGTALCQWWSIDLDADQRQRVSPRKLEYIGQLIKKGMDLGSGDALTPNCRVEYFEVDGVAVRDQ